MPLETTTFINGLDANNPAAGDTVGQADDHIRLIKASVKATFPNITGAVTVSQADLNATQNLQAVLNGKAASVHTHAISDVTGLQAALDGKAPTSHTHTSSQITDSTATGRDLLTAASPTAVRTYLGAAASGAIGSSGMTMSTGRLLGRTSASAGAVEEISVGSGLSLSGGTLGLTNSGAPTFRTQTFTSSGTWTVPAGVTRVKVWVIGAGGGGGAGNSGAENDPSGGPGGNGGSALAYVDVTPGASITVTVGTGGTGSNTGAGTSGGTTSFGSLISATGGGGGGAAPPDVTGTPGANGSGTGSTLGPSLPLTTSLANPVTSAAPAPASISGNGLNAGTGGSPEGGPSGNNARGGVGGFVYLEWVGY
ncbi:Phage tail repeat like [uncultured Caudovirales phage]|uniref:Phage tail repeat like n=1 Tax=uncultured Caudovirales phage TaxID=2100421 RepID=A0A6J5NU03_9CAUD|nr:Phage tail repeat like [uncultured Caudovirales phage]